ncbi:MAG TPA: TauD/TfdA family dioxygenase [Acetobacteraceae bacterium]|nr:TauD/TfdA family dioxygenase [Acetobacteraceae bacterium]
MAIGIRPFQAGLGADITGVDIRAPLSPADRDQILAAWHNHLVVRFRGQPMSDEQHMAFTRNFGELEFAAEKLVERTYGVTSDTANRTGVPPQIAVISNIVENGKPIGALGSGEAFWHTDSSFVDVPPAGSFLRAIEVPPRGGATYFLNMYAAYDTLPDDVQHRIADLQAIHPMTHSSSGKPRKGFENITDVTQVPGPRHPLVRTHPDTGRKCLFLGRRLNAYVCGLPVEESEALLDRLWAHATQEKFTWRQEWQVGDLIIWDNRCAMHRRDPFDPAARRLMHRTQTKGTRPV